MHSSLSVTPRRGERRWSPSPSTADPLFAVETLALDIEQHCLPEGRGVSRGLLDATMRYQGRRRAESGQRSCRGLRRSSGGDEEGLGQVIDTREPLGHVSHRHHRRDQRLGHRRHQEVAALHRDLPEASLGQPL